MSNNELTKKSGEESGNGKFLNEIDAITKALYEDKTQSRTLMPSASNQSKSVAKPQSPETKSKSISNSSDDRFLKDKKSKWSWKALTAFTHVRNKRFNCCFSLQVHSIEGLPPSFNDIRLCVKWKRRDGELTTRPAIVSQGVAEFEELLTITCSVYGSRSGPHHSAKYEAKHFLLYASIYGDPELDLGKHRVDLTRLLPLTLEELEEEKSSGKWTTSYRLSGKGNGATMNVSFGYSVVGRSPSDPTRQNSIGSVKSHRKASGQSPTDGQGPIRRGGSLPVRSRASSRSVEDIKDLHEVLPISKSELSKSVDMLYKKLEEDKSVISVDYEPQQDVEIVPLEPPKPDSFSPDSDNGNVGSEFSVVELKPEEGSIKACEEEEGKMKGYHGSEKPALEEDPDLESLMVSKLESKKEEPVVFDGSTKEQDVGDKELLMKELESALNSVADMVKEESDSQEEGEILKEVTLNHEDVICHENTANLDGKKYKECKLGYKGPRKGKSLSLDYATETVASDFLSSLGIVHSPFGLSSESEPDSPRERLLRQFENDSLADSSSLFNFNIDDDGQTVFSSVWGPISEEHDSSSMLQASEEMLKLEIQETQIKSKASILEDLETEALMREWGLNEKAFQRSPPMTSGGLGSPIDLPEELAGLPPLGEGLGPFVQTSNGGFLRSMNPEIFRNAKSGGSLIMQVSSPVVVPAEMGSGIMDILQCLASVGIEKLSMQANKVMPLEDISGKTMQQIAWEATPTLEAPERQAKEPEIGQIAPDDHRKDKGQPFGRKLKKYESSSVVKGTDPEYVSLEDLAPLAMNKIEALSLEGLRIQSGMSDEDAPSNISPQSIGEISAFEGKRVNFGGSLGLEGTGGLQLLDIKKNSDNNNDNVDGIMGLSVTLDEWMRLDAGEIDDGDEISERTSRILAAHHASDLMRTRTRDKRKGKSSRKGGFLGNNFTVALMVQLRDPLRNFEPVGTPMLALIQVERVFIPPKPKIYTTVCELWETPEEDKDDVKKQEPKEEEEEKVVKEENVEIPQFKITEVHVAGLKTEPNKKKHWGSNGQQQQSGSRWLLANGMGKKNTKHPLMKSKAGGNKASSSDSLWSISSKAKGSSVKVSPPVRNPNVIIPNETVKLLSGAGFV